MPQAEQHLLWKKITFLKWFQRDIFIANRKTFPVLRKVGD